MQSHWMQPNWAEENLQTIRTLMERSALYRRALAPIVLFAGIMGVLAATVGLALQLNITRPFGLLWMGTAVVVILGALVIARRQAFKEGETFWSPPTRRVVQALLPPLVIGMILGLIFTFPNDDDADLLPIVWALCYGCALHSAGFFIARGVKWFGWLYIVTAFGIIFGFDIIPHSTLNFLLNLSPNWLMGFFFGLLHLIYGAYLYLTEKGKNAA
jgi:hypothetical protein